MREDFATGADLPPRLLSQRTATRESGLQTLSLEPLMVAVAPQPVREDPKRLAPLEDPGVPWVRPLSASCTAEPHLRKSALQMLKMVVGGFCHVPANQAGN